MTDRPVHLAQRSSRGRRLLKSAELALPAHAEFGGHAPPDETGTHRRRMRLQLAELCGKFRRQEIGNGGQELGNLHQRPLERAESCAEELRFLAEIGLVGHHPSRGEPCRGGAKPRSHARIAAQPRAEPVSLSVARLILHVLALSSASISLTKFSITDRPFSQNEGSDASRPKGARSSL